ncbi:NADP(H)-dependent aldo-keto reductase [Echinimonas agarilytica]|uniref:Protein tas n=1 Tax=Echinimonas agarilytica TaxID=1215918 RepID=A0AA41WBB4_9GAMM|nr:NADP(H)-dependent aldo-keto reductase [Echinimonas agarilytica]
MKYTQLGQTDLRVSMACIGTMTFGQQNTVEEAAQQLNYAVANGVNFIDTAEMYPIPPTPETQGDTERFIGKWLKGRSDRDELIIASKVAATGGPSVQIRPHMALNASNIELALDSSLNRLGTDYLDLYQVHWPERSTNYFGQLNYQHTEESNLTPIMETLEALLKCQRAGKIRHIGISNETPWGAAEYLKLSALHDLPRIASIQNPYNLLNRSFEVGMAEIAIREQVPLLAYSPLAFGALSGKYLNDQKPEGARMTRYTRFVRYTNARGVDATQRYFELALEHQIDPAQMAIAFAAQQPFIGSVILGATNLEQLSNNIEACAMDLSEELNQGIEAIFQQNPNPCP